MLNSRLRSISIGICLLLSVPCFATVEVLLLGQVDENGRTIQLEENGRYIHSAIRVGSKWLHSYPGRPVEFVDDIHKYGDFFLYLVNPDLPDLQVSDVSAYLGLPFDPYYRWAPTDKTYCSKLVAEVLRIEPQPMEFSEAIYGEELSQRRGEPGLSPDDLAQILTTSKGFKVVSSCSSLLSTKHRF